MDSAFKPAPFSGYTNRELARFIADGFNPKIPAMKAELARREKVRLGDRSVMTDGERLRYARSTRLADQLDHQISAIVNGGFLDPLDAAGLFAIARELDPTARMESSFDGYLHISFADLSVAVFDDEEMRG